MILPDSLEVTVISLNRASILKMADEKAAKYFGGILHHRITARVTEELEHGRVGLFNATVTYESIGETRAR